MSEVKAERQWRRWAKAITLVITIWKVISNTIIAFQWICCNDKQTSQEPYALCCCPGNTVTAASMLNILHLHRCWPTTDTVLCCWYDFFFLSFFFFCCFCPHSTRFHLPHRISCYSNITRICQWFTFQSTSEPCIYIRRLSFRFHARTTHFSVPLCFSPFLMPFQTHWKR